MANITNKAGTTVGNAYKLISENPLDVRFVVDDITERDSIVSSKGCYPGLEVWVKSENKKYTAIPNGSTYTWNEASNISNYYWANIKISEESSTATTPTVQKIGITGSTTKTANAAVTMEYDSTLKALKFVFA